MGRTIKFRIWDNKAKKMLYPDALAFYKKQYKGYFSNCIGVFEDGDDVQQYTGLVDRESKEIYEGDIIRAYIDGGFGSGEVFAEVKFIAGGFKIELQNSVMEVSRLKEIKVLGNIFENEPWF